MESGLQDLILPLTIVVMLVGLIGIVMPVIPGTLLIFAAGLAYAVFDRFQAVGWPTLVVLGVLALIATTADLWATGMGAKAGRASGWSVLAGVIGGVIGFFVIPVLGGVIGAILGILLAELLRVRDWRQAFRAGGGWLAGWLLSVVVQVVIGLVMIAIFYWQATGGRLFR